MNKDIKGFTLVELLVVISIIAILAAIVAPSALSSVEKSKASAFFADAEAIKKSMLLYYADTGEYPKYRLVGENKEAFMWIASTFLVDGDFSSPPSGVTVRPHGYKSTSGTYVVQPKSGTWDGPYLDRWPQKTPFGGYYYLFDYDPAIYSGLNTFLPGAQGVRRFDDEGNLVSNLYADFNGARVVVFEICFESDQAARDKAVKILKKFGNSESVYQQNINGTFNLMIPVLVN